MAFVFCTFLRLVNSCFCSACLPVDVGVAVDCVVDPVFFHGLHTTVGVYQFRLMERLGFVIAVSVLCSDNVSVKVGLCLPCGLVKQLSIGLESTSSWATLVFSHAFIKLNLANCQFDMCVGLGSILWVQVSLSKGGAPLFIQAWMGLQNCRLTVSSEEAWPGGIECPLVFYKPVGLPSMMSLLELIFFNKASPANFS